MRHIVYYLLIVTLFTACKKGSDTGSNSKVDIYLLKSFSITVDTTNPYSTKISNAVLDDIPLVGNDDIAYYTASTTTFGLKKNIKPLIQNFTHNHAFAVTVDKQPVYFGLFHPAYYSSLIFDLATIDPVLTTGTEMRIGYITNAPYLSTPDKRNDNHIISVLRSTGRLR